VPDVAQLTCLLCGEQFALTRPNKKYCSASCQTVANRAATKAKREIVKKPLGPMRCDGCGQIYIRTAPKQRFCKVTCGQRIQTRKRLGLRGPSSIIRPCEYCTAEFSSVDGRTKYCGDECARTAKSLRESFRRYGITMQEYRRLWLKQEGVCAICHQPERTERNNLLTIDHDHVTGHIRGLLCSHCNRAIGLLQDDPKVIAAAAAYVRRHRQVPLFT
jgi:Recombination endonuclease VII